MNKAVVVNQELFGDWIYDIVSEKDQLDIFVIKTTQPSLIYRALFMLDMFFFKGGKRRCSLKEEHNVYEIYNINDVTDSEQRPCIFNFTNQFIEKPKIIQYNFSIEDDYNIFKQVINATILNSYKKVKLKIQQGDTEFTTTVRYDPISFSRNFDLTIDTFLAIIKSNLDGLEPNSETQNLITNGFTFPKILKYYTRFYHKIMDYMFHNQQWYLAFNFSDSIIAPYNHKKLIKITPPKDRFWADPIVVFENNIYYVFIEELLYSNKKGHISVFEINKDGHFTKPQMIIEKDYHLSYPFVFKYEDQYYMIPETSHNSTIELYESKNFPYKWEFKKTIFQNIKATDSTLIEHNGVWWMFTSIREYNNGTYDNTLSVFFTKNPIEGNWKKHTLNTIKNNIESSRQGGPFIKDNKGNLYRVSQNASVNYGYGYNIHKITEINEFAFKEKTVYSYEPKDANTIGVHTFSNVNGIQVYDVLRKISK